MENETTLPIRNGYSEVELLPKPFKLLSFQVEAVFKMLKFLNENRGCYNACEMGLGKCVQTIALLNILKPARVLIVCPAIMRLVWEKELKKFCLHDKLLPSFVMESSKDYKFLNEQIESNYASTGCVICSYELASSEKAIQLFKKCKFNLLICDESHRLKTRSTKRTKAILHNLLPHIPKVIALSGSPITSCVTDLYTWANALAPDTFPNYYKFANRYAEQVRSPFGIKYEGLRNEAELNPLIRKLFFFRYLKQDVLPELPPKQFTEIPLPESYAVKSLPDYKPNQIQGALERFQGTLEGTNHGPTFEEQNIIKSIRQAQGIATIKPVAEFVRNLLEQDIPVVCFAHHKAVIAGLYKELAKFDPAFITGEIGSKDREFEISRFQCGVTNLFLGQMQASGVGITLTRSSTVVFAELDYTPATINQAIDRVHRISATAESINIYYFTIAQNSIVNRIISVLIKKAQSFNRLMTGEKPHVF